MAIDVASEKSMSPAPAVDADRSVAARILARSFYKELRSSGYAARQILALSTELIELITADLQKDRQEPKRAA